MKNYIPSLNGLRAISIILVLLHHIQTQFMDGVVVPFPFSVFFDGSLGVNVFFVISGFLITKLLMEEQAATGTVDLKDFYIRRAFRIFPAYYFLLFVYFILQLFAVFSLTKGSWLSSLFYYKYFHPNQDWETTHFWSLSVEEHFYLVWPMVFLFLKPLRVWFALAVIGTVMAFRYYAYIHPDPLSMVNNKLFIFQRVDAIMIGCLFALYRERIGKWTDKLSRYGWAPFAIIALMFFLAYGYPGIWNMKYHLHLGFLIIPLGLDSSTGLIINILIGLLLMVSISERHIWYKFLNLPWMNFIGKLSYSIYLWQMLFFSKHIGPLGKMPWCILGIAVSALISYRFIEQPFLRLKKRFEVLKEPRSSKDVNSRYLQKLSS